MLLLALAMLFLSVSFIVLLNYSVKSQQALELRETCVEISGVVSEGSADDLDFLTLPYYIIYTVYDESRQVLSTNDPLLPLLDSGGKVLEYFEKDYFIDSDLNVRYLTQNVRLDDGSSITVETAIDIENDSAAKMLYAVPRLVLISLVPLLLLSFAISFLISRKTISTFKKLRDDYDRERTFTSNVSHELKTPISIIDGHANLIKRWGKNDEKQLEESVDAILRETSNMNRIVTILLELSKLEEGQIKIEKEKVDIGDFFDSLRSEYPDAIEEPVISNSAGEGKDAPVEIFTDRQKLHQIFVILISNSLKFSGSGCRIKLEASQDGKKTSLSVTDNGPGFESDVMPHVFERFYKGDKARTRQGDKSGAGLGLSIAKTLCKLLDADISAQNAGSGGAQVTITVYNSFTEEL